MDMAFMVSSPELHSNISKVQEAME